MGQEEEAEQKLGGLAEKDSIGEAGTTASVPIYHVAFT